MLKEIAGPEMVSGPAAVPGTIPLLKMPTPVWAVFVLVLVATGFSGSLAGTLPSGGDSFLRDEFLVLGDGASGSWRSLGARSGFAFDQIGGDGLDDEFGGSSVQQEEEEKVQGPSNTGKKVKAGLLSAVLPGAGQFYNHQNSKGYIMVGVEVAIWTAYFVFDAQGDARMESAREWAGIYAGTDGEHENSYWPNVGHYMDSDAYNDSRLREARALQEPVTGLIGGGDAWQWVNEDRKDGYSKLRADGNSAYDRRDFMILFAVVNRTVSVVDAVLNAGKQDGILETEVLGMNVELEMLPSFTDPGARWVVSRSF
jgi:TM2 domain-containing membrane protein YozV